MRLAVHVACMGEMRNAYDIVVGKPEGKRSLGRPKCRWKGNIGKDLGEIGWEDVKQIHLTYDREQ